MDQNDLSQKLLEFVERPNYRPLKPRQIAKKLEVPEDELQDFKRLVKKHVREGKLTYGVKHLVLPAKAPAAAAADGKGKAAKAGQLSGVFRRTQQGFGFVRPAGAGVTHTREQDIFIGAEHAGDAASGDLVLVRLLKGRGRFGQPQGAIVEVIERETHQFVGTYFERNGAAFVQVDGTLFAQAISVGDPGAKNAQPDDKVVFEMVRFPSHVHDGEGVITEVLGPRGEPGIDTLSIIREFNLPQEFAADAMEAARIEAEQFDESIAAGRVDLTAETVVTIDPVDARDFDDAISLKREPNGHWLLGVHIADVSHFVRAGGPLDREAHERSTSVYLPDRVIPMLPEIISNGLASLQPDRVRYTKTAFLEFTADGVHVSTELHSAAIRSDRRFTYEEIDEYLADPDAWRHRLSPQVHELAGRMHELAMILRKRRLNRGALELALREVKVDLDKHGRVVGAHAVENTKSHQIIEEFMLAANIAVAERLEKQDWQFLRRVHLPPDPRKLKALTEFVASLGFQTESLESRFELQRLLGEVAERPERQAVNYAVLRSLQRAAYSPEQAGHYALASDCYCHFTSPIRRYPDLTIHRLIDALLTHGKPRNELGELIVLGEHCSDRERRAEEAERELTKVKLLNYLSNHIGLELDAVVTGVEQFGLFVQGTALPAEGLIHVTSLSDDYYSFDRATHTLAGRRAGNSFRLGDPVRVVVARVDVDRRELDFRIVERQARPPRAAKPQQRKDESARSAKGGKGIKGGKPAAPKSPRRRKKN
ncbi:MAG TPA: ribonuclease R [Pirellulales bacterium]|nr:ribonuclease R [Pirellulales bacterium]